MRLPGTSSALVVAFCCLSIAAQRPAPAPPQTARQALIEMITGGEKGFNKHLTVEVQQALNQKENAQTATMMKMYSFGLSGAGGGLQTFDSGPVLASIAEPGGHTKMEIHVESDDLSGDVDNLGLSIHSSVDGQEQTTLDWQMMVSGFTVEMKRQGGLWRLNKVTIGVALSLGDPTFLEGLFGQRSVGRDPGFARTPQTDVQLKSGEGISNTIPDMPAQDVVTMLAMAESLFARSHPDAGFACSLSDLADSSKMMGLDPQVSTGTYNGYRFALKGCEGHPAGSYQITAEPITPSPGAKAFCTDATQNLRESDDGRVSTCLAAGKMNSNASEGGVVGFRALGTVEAKPKE